MKAEVEWEYFVGYRAYAARNGKLNVAFNGLAWKREEHTIAIVTPDAVSSDEPINDDEW